jgi:carbonic anhydrase
VDSEEVIATLKEGNRRFATANSTHRVYSPTDLSEMALGQTPIAAIVACADSRVSPDIVFDQPLGSIFASRVPGNVASDSAKWMIDIAVGVFEVPLVVVMAHSGCLAIHQVVEGIDGPGGVLRQLVHEAFLEERRRPGPDLLERTINENARKTCRDLMAESQALSDAHRAGRTNIVAARFDIETGQVVWLD